MKKITLLILTTLFIFITTGCIKRDNLEGIDIYTTNYPIEYITNYLYGENSNIMSIYPNGVNIEDYELTKKQIKDFSKGSIFIYNGLSKEKDYVIPLFEYNKDIKIIDASLSMEYTNSVEELWLDPSNFLMLAQNTKNGFNEYITNQYLKKEIDENYNKLKIEISNIDANLRLISESSDNKNIVVSNDIFKFLEKYNFNVISLEENENLTEKIINDVKNMIIDKKISYIFLKENEKINETINKLKNETDVELITLKSISNLSEKDKTDKKDYISLMNENVNLLKNELYD